MLFKRKQQPAEVPILAQLCSLERELFEARAAAQSEIASRQASTAKELTARLLAGEDMAAIFEDDQQSKDELCRIDLAHTSCRASRLAAISDSLKTEPAKLRAAAAEKVREAEKIDKQTAPLLAKLATLEGVPYTGEILLAARSGTWNDRAIVTGKPRARCSPFEVIPADLDGGFHVPKSEALRNEADALQAQAERAEQRQPAHAGYVEGSSLAEILDQLFARPEILGPPAADVVAYLNQATGQAPNPVFVGSHLLRNGEVITDPEKLSTIIRVAWKNFTVDEGNCYVQRYLRREEAA